jgi:YidC/Oxa1 family membrane protein insertase
MSVSKVREVHNPQQRGSKDAAGFLVLVLAVFFVWFGVQQFPGASQHAAPVVQHVAVAVNAPTDGFGRWGIVARPMLFLLGWVHTHVVANWGWAIVILTGMINLALWPTRVMSLRSTLKMQRIQPQMEAIKSRYKEMSLTDPRRQEMQREIAALQKSEGVNMFGGCLPALIPWPLLVGFYKMLAGAVALRGASWLWVRDLAVADTHHVLPMLVVVTMAASQLLTPTPGMDVKQQRVMALVMPLVFGVFAWKYASGLALYFVCSNVFGVLQQMAMNRTATGRELRKAA